MQNNDELKIVSIGGNHNRHLYYINTINKINHISGSIIEKRESSIPQPPEEISSLDKKKFVKTIENLKCSNDAINFYIEENLKKNTFFSPIKGKLILNKNFFKQPYEVTFRAFSDSIKLVGKKYYSARGKKLDKIINDIKKNKLYKGTLGGCIIEKVDQTVILSKE